MTKRITLPSGGYLLVKVQKGQKVKQANDGDIYTYYGSGIVTGNRLHLPPGNYSLIGQSPLELTEEECAGIVDEKSLTTGGYIDYERLMENKEFAFCDTTIESYHSLLKAYGFNPGETVILKIK